MRNLVAVFLGGIILAGCATGGGVTADGIAKKVDENALNLNNAHARAINGVIIVNILRARDGWPTGYTTLSGVRFTPEREISGGLNFSPLGLGNPGNPFNESSADFNSEISTSAQYSINPFADQNTSQGLYSTSASEELFRRYYDAGWPMEISFLMFVQSVERDGVRCPVAGDHYIANKLNNKLNVMGDEDDKEMRTLCDDVINDVFASLMLVESDQEKQEVIYQLDSMYRCHDVHTRRCVEEDASERSKARRASIVNQVEENARARSEERRVVIAGHEDNNNTSSSCVPIVGFTIQNLLVGDAEGISAKISAIEAASGKQVLLTEAGVGLCDRIPSHRSFYIAEDWSPEEGKEKYKYRKLFDGFRFRSFDDMVHFVGETLRNEDDELYIDANEKKETTSAGEEVCNETRVPLFRVRSALDPALSVRRGYGVEVSHAGQNWVALPEQKNEEYKLDCKIERTGTVLSILSQFYLLNQSSAFLAAPEDILLQ